MSATSAGQSGWQGRPLSQVEETAAPEPTIGDGRLVYPGARHMFIGEPESGKTIAAYATALEQLRNGRDTTWVALVDFEMGDAIARQRFSEMGATDHELDRIMLFSPDTAPRGDELSRALLEWDDMNEPRPVLVIFDAWAGASALLGLDEDKRSGIEEFARIYLKPLWESGVPTIVIDHVAKSKDGRGRWAIGSERKIGVVDVALGFEAKKQVSRGHDGLVEVTTAKDRFGHLPRKTAAMLELHSHPKTDALSWTWTPPAATDATDGFRPTILMGRVSDFLEKQNEPVSLRTVEDSGLGKSREHIRKAVELLIADGYVTESRGPRRARMLTLECPYIASPDFAATSPGDDGATSPDFARPLQGGEVRGEVNVARSNVHLSGEVERLADQHPELTT